MTLPTSPPPEHHFSYHGEHLPYFHHMYNMTWMNERAVEVAVARNFLSKIPRDKRDFGVEVGNVLGHYGRCRHEVIDLHEKAAWYQDMVPQHVYPWDILDPERTLNGSWVISLSTVEHTDFPLTSIARLRSMVEPGGKLLVSFPTGEHEQLDGLVRSLDMSVWTRFCTISRTAPGSEIWAQDMEPRVQEYGPWANTVALLEWERPA